MHDPFQSYQTLGAYSGVSPFSQPYGLQPPFAGQGIGAYGIHPQQLHQLQQQLHQQLQQLQHLQLLQAMQGQGQIPGPTFPGANPLSSGFQQPVFQNPLAGLQNQWINPQQYPQQNPILAHQGWPQQGWPQQQQFGYPLAPQSLLGGGMGYGTPGIGAINPLATQFALRALATGGSPFAC
jgi:hypothetical protein